MPITSALGHAAAPLFVFKGSRVPYSTFIKDGKEVVQIFADFVPRRSMIAVREQNGGVDSRNFLNWAFAFVRELTNLMLMGGNCTDL